MSPAHVLEPTYRRLKRALMEGNWPGGTRLEARKLADEFGVSMTPVRDSLNQLVGEGLVSQTPGEGFRVPVITEQGLRDMLSVNAALLEFAIHSDWNLPDIALREDRDRSYSGRLATAFTSLANGSANRYLASLIDRINDQLHLVRSYEPDVVPRAGEILRRIEASLRETSNDRQCVIRYYHDRCRAAVPKLMKCLEK